MEFIYLIIFGILIITFYSTPLIIAVSEGHIEIVQLFLSQPSIDINYQAILTINIHQIKIYFFLIIFDFIIIFGIQFK